MGLLSTRKPKPAFAPPELPMTHVPAHRRASQRRASIMDSIRAMSLSAPSTDPDGFRRSSGTQGESSSFGRRLSQAFVPTFARKASTAAAVGRNRSSVGLRAGESDTGGQDNMKDALYNARLTIDEASDDEGDEDDGDDDIDEKWASRKGKARARMPPVPGGGWMIRLGWDVDSPTRARPGKRTGSNRKHRSRRVVRRLDKDLDAYNSYAQNGMTPLTRSLQNSRNPSVTSFPSTFGGRALIHVTDDLDSDSVVMPDDRARAVLMGDGYDALDVMADYIFRVGVQKKKWFRPPKMMSTKNIPATGVSLRVKTGLYRTFPVGYDELEEWEEAITRLNPEVAVKIHSSIVTSIMTTYINPTPSMTELLIDANTRIQILDEIEHLARARKHQYAAFIRSEGVLCVWADHVEAVMPAAEALEEALIQFIWRGEEENKKINQAVMMDAEMMEEEKLMAEDLHNELTVGMEDSEDVVKRKIKRHWKERPVMLYAPLSDALAIMLGMALIALGIRTLIKEYILDHSPIRFALILFMVPIFCIAAFACLCVVGSIFQILGPIRQMASKSVYYSGVAPRRTMGELMHVTVQLPVYKEDLNEVIKPTITSLKRAITTYERQGGSVGILVCDDGLQLLSVEEADRRRAFYFDNNIAYVSRPGHGVDGFIRKGRFKKAGNMNYANALSLRVEEIMDDLRPAAQDAKEADAFWADTDENLVYDAALVQALEEKKGEAWAAGNIRIGEIILIIDSDTRVPEDCFADAVSEMTESPEVAIIQHMSGVMQVAHHFFENGVAHFTRGIQHAISYCCASGEVAPFVGHNAFLRWSALQECLHVDPDDGVMKIWSEDHVSEDFQIAVTLQIKGYVVRWAAYSEGEFEEGVSLTCDDELNRWQKYAFGCSELLFYPIRQWPRRGIITPLFKQFFWSTIPMHSKFSICGYIFSYYAIACSWFLTLANFFIKGWDLNVDAYYLPSWEVCLVCIILFAGLCNVAFIVLRYRLKLPDSGKIAFDQIKWIPFFSIFFTGMSLPISAALASHLVGYNMSWSTTIKIVEKSNFFLQLPIIWRRFNIQLVVFGLCMVAMAVLSTKFIPSGFRIDNLEVFVPMALVGGSHLLWPFALNPWFLSFSF